ncbi:MAG: pyridoxamine 5'-phosphate oxidase [Actinobacteria bacterium]|nr:pyridoxamine 5'-phosphate oxidase [Actinomycetota bacterium]
MELEDLGPDPIAAFRTWHADAGTDAACLATASPDGGPSARMILLKGASATGFVFHTNRTSPKGRDLAVNPRAALVFHWAPHRQVRVSGPVELLAEAESDAYWATRPRGSQLAAWASEQSQVIASRQVLDAALAAASERFAADDVPRPQHWGGYRVVPATIEFWQHGEDRLHDRIRYIRKGWGWAPERLSP